MRMPQIKNHCQKYSSQYSRVIRMASPVIFETSCVSALLVRLKLFPLSRWNNTASYRLVFVWETRAGEPADCFPRSNECTLSFYFLFCLSLNAIFLLVCFFDISYLTRSMSFAFSSCEGTWSIQAGLKIPANTGISGHERSAPTDQFGKSPPRQMYYWSLDWRSVSAGFAHRLALVNHSTLSQVF